MKTFLLAVVFLNLPVLAQAEDRPQYVYHCECKLEYMELVWGEYYFSLNYFRSDIAKGEVELVQRLARFNAGGNSWTGHKDPKQSRIAQGNCYREMYTQALCRQ